MAQQLQKSNMMKVLIVTNDIKLLQIFKSELATRYPLLDEIAVIDSGSSDKTREIAASFGADFLCYVTASEHLRLPTLEDVREGVVATRIAAHAADIAKGIKKAIEWDAKISTARKERDWKKQIELAIDPRRPGQMRRKFKSSIPDVCTMCSQYCSLKLMDSAKKALKR